jgi:hypothetical protein
VAFSGIGFALLWFARLRSWPEADSEAGFVPQRRAVQSGMSANVQIDPPVGTLSSV